MSLSHRAGVLSLWAATFAVPGARALVAQNATLEGFVLASSTGRRLEGVLLVLESGPRAWTKDEGAYRLENIPPGLHRVALVAPGCQLTFASVEVWPDETRSLAFEIAYDPDVAEQLARRRRSSGKVVSAQEIEAMHVTTLLDLLSRVAPGMTWSQPNQPGRDATVRSRSQVNARESIAPALVLDGMVLGSSGYDALQDIRPSDVAWIEVLAGASGGWDVGTGGSGGLVRIQTKRGRVPDAFFLEPDECEIPWGGSGEMR